MAYPLHLADQALSNLERTAARLNTNVFIGPVGKSPHGDEYRNARADATRIDWGRVKVAAFKDGWKAFGHDGIVYDLPDRNFLVVEPVF